MKKRSLIASIAMLLVSAIVLSTSTYAWFSTGAAVSVEKITAEISATDGSVEIRAKDLSSMTEAQLTAAGLTAKDVGWTNTLKASVLEYLFDSSDANYIMPDNLIPITVNPGTAVSEKTGVYSGTLNTRTGTFGTEFFNHDANADTPDLAVYKLITGANGTGNEGKGENKTNRFVKYQFEIKANAACTVTLKPTFSTGKDFIFGAVNDGTNTYIYGNGTKTYAPVAQNSTIRDIDKDGIVTSTNYDSSTGSGDNIATNNDTSAVLEGTVSSGTTDVSEISLVYAAAGTKTITVYIWAEGQQEACTGAVTASNASFSFEAIKAA